MKRQILLEMHTNQNIQLQESKEYGIEFLITLTQGNKKPSRVLEKIDMNKTMDEVIDSIKDEKFDKFTKGAIDSVHKKSGYDPDDDNKKEIATLS